MIIGLTGLAGSGKSLVAAHLAERHGFRVLKFAGPLKAMMRALLAEAGIDRDIAESMIEGHRKEQPSEALSGHTPRHAMQTLGTEWGRTCIDHGFWVDVWKSAATAWGGRIVADDCRFLNEVGAVHDLGGAVVGVYRAGLSTGSHVSENANLPRDFWIVNDADITHLCDEADRVVEMLGKRRAA